MLGPPHWGVATSAMLRHHGLTPHQINRLLSNGVLSSPRRGWFVLDSVPPSVLTAVRLRDQLTGTAALKLQYGCWTHPDSQIHIAIPKSSAAAADSTRTQQTARTHISRTAKASPPVRGVFECIEDAVR